MFRTSTFGWPPQYVTKASTLTNPMQVAGIAKQFVSKHTALHISLASRLALFPHWKSFALVHS